jgi:RHS repeat-associated protein
MIKYYYAGSQRVAMRECVDSTCGDPMYLHSDHLGNASLATDDDGELISDIRYYPYGSTRSGTVGTDYRYTGQRAEPIAGGIYDYRARYYDPYINLWVQPDTIIPNPSNPQTFNRYAYTLGNPLKYSDPTGNYSEEEIMESFGVNTWEEVLAIFESGRLAGLWGWLEVLRKAEDGYFVSGNMDLMFSAPGQANGWKWGGPYNGNFFSRNEKGQILVGGNSHLDFASSHRDIYSLWQRDSIVPYIWEGKLWTAFGTKHYHIRFDPNQFNWLDAGMDIAGIGMDVFTGGVGGRVANLGQLIVAATSKGLDIVDLIISIYTGAKDKHISNYDLYSVGLSAWGLKKPILPDVISLSLNLREALSITP